MSVKKRLGLCVVLLSLGASLLPYGNAWAQLGGVDAEFAGAGARALSMGGAFIGLADDSTAAEFNPAGLQILLRPELAWQVTHTFDRREEYLPLTSPTGRGLESPDQNEWTTPSFVSYVHPGQEYTWAISQLTTIDFDHHFSDEGRNRLLVSDTEATNNAFGFSVATDIKPRLHLGVTLRMNRFDYSYEETQTVDFKGSITERTGYREFSDWSPSFNVGLLWRATEKWSFGSVYKSQQTVETSDFKTRLPQTFGVGAAYHPNDELRLLADVDYITWSDFDSAPGDDFHRDDVMRYHLGGEYLFRLEEDRAWFIRGGYMREDSNALFYNGNNPALMEAFAKEPDKDHLSIGLGLATEKYQIDWGIDHVLDGSTIFILSMVHYF
ncbi:MAG: outer membrane protein transport protein [Candidatus Omnitrophica bacterium]|nr:outer membrane protein transport protein [Candidatus Omnitrophota bacterium]